MVCLACGQVLPEVMVFLASLRCEECRESGAPIRQEFVKPKAG